MAIGTVKLLRADKGFGIIKYDRGSKGSVTVIFDRTAIPRGDFSRLREGQRVSFEETRDVDDPNIRRAANVQPEREINDRSR
jgi:cold shock CspA family protein